MCSRYELAAAPRTLAERFGLEAPPPETAADLWPTAKALTILPGPSAVLRRWGLPPPGNGRPLINARAETLAQKPAFRPLLARRCLVPATAYIEWHRAPGGKRPVRIRPADGAPFAFAGLADETHFTVVTCRPAPSVAGIHPRMPVILPRDAENSWLDAKRPFAEVDFLLTPFPALLEIVDIPVERPQPDLFDEIP